MIATDLDNASGQLPLSAAFAKALAFLRRGDISSLPDGKYEIDGERVFAMAQRYQTVPGEGPKFEAHRKYIDLQYIAAGEEVIGWAPLRLMEVSEAYDVGRDVCFGPVKAGLWTPVRLCAGQLAVLYPEDAHAPRLAAGASSPVVKVVVKVACDASATLNKI